MPLESKSSLRLEIDLTELDRDPYPLYEQIRAMGGAAWIEPLGIWYVVGYNHCRAVLSDEVHFAVGTDRSLILETFGTNMLTLDGDAHRRERDSFRAGFGPAAIRQAMSDAVGAIVDRLIDNFAGRREIDLRTDFAARLPVLAVLTLFGFDPAVEPQMRQWYDCFERALSNFAREEQPRRLAREAAAEFDILFRNRIEEARSHPGNDLLSSVIRAEPSDRLSDDEIVRNALLIFFGGISTVEALLLNTLYAARLHGHMLYRNNALAAIEETMRWLSPVQSATRHVVVETGIFAAGETVNCMIGGANRDPAIFADPAEWNPARGNAAHHLGFAAGPHFCLGNHLARLEATIAISRIAERLPTLKIIDPLSTEVRGSEFRQPRSLMAVVGI